jgi:hypothetical protein
MVGAVLIENDDNLDLDGIIKWVASFKLSLLLKNYLQRIQTLQLN